MNNYLKHFCLISTITHFDNKIIFRGCSERKPECYRSLFPDSLGLTVTFLYDPASFTSRRLLPQLHNTPKGLCWVEIWVELQSLSCSTSVLPFHFMKAKLTMKGCTWLTVMLRVTVILLWSYVSRKNIGTPSLCAVFPEFMSQPAISISQHDSSQQAVFLLISQYL